MSIGPTWHVSAFTHRGLVRDHNEDAIAINDRILSGDLASPLEIRLNQQGCVLMVADGLGGHNAGAIASRFIVEQLVELISRTATTSNCAKAISEVNQNLHDLSRQEPELAGMGSTLVGVVLRQSEMVSFNVGDSRLYLQTPRHLVQLSQDDVPKGSIDRQGIRATHRITQTLGGAFRIVAVDPHVSVDPSLAGDEILLLCSDGLTDLVSDDTISRVLTASRTALSATRRLAALAFRRGGYDNISIVVARRAQI